ncbi:MAG: hypothetical protein EOL87_01180 [Spartobacteria bacterium]|nr:hypothetical protein [Spartobacteria bacterium]
MNRMNSLKFVVSLGVVMMLSSLAYGRAGISLDPASDSVDAFGGTPSFNVGIDAPDLYWIPAESESWITISSVDNATYTAGYGYQGSGTVHLIAFENSSASNRVGTVTVKDAVFTLTQEVAVCTSTVTPQNIECSKSIAQDVTIKVGTSNESCEWQFIPVSDWISLKSVQTVFTGTVNNLLIHLESNEGCAARSGSCIIAGKTVTITQPAVPFTMNPSSYAAPSEASTVGVTITAGSNCEWYVKTLSWVAMKSTNYGYSYGYNYAFTGPQTVELSVFANDSRSQRSGSVLFKDQTFDVDQTACEFKFSPKSVTKSKNGGSFTVSVDYGSACTWYAQQMVSWITFSEATRGHSLGYGYQNGYGYGYKFKGDQSLVMNVFKNDTSVKREGSICFYDRFFDGLIDSVDVTQGAAGAYVPYLILMDE